MTMKRITKEQEHFAFRGDLTPALRAESGESVIFECQDCYCGQILEDGFPFERMEMKHNNPATGPLYVEGAMPGDILKVEIKRIRLDSSGCMCVRKGVGVYEIEGSHCRRYAISDGQVLFDEGIRFPIRPMIGVIGTAPLAGEESTLTPGEHGGNMDIRDLGEGSTLYLPVNVPGALLSMGDLHGVQGDGETVICALEAAGEVTVNVSVQKERRDIPTPFLVTASHYLTTASDESLDQCSKDAARKMHRFLQEHSPLSDFQCGVLLSMQGNLRISQVVNPKKGCIMEFPVGLARETFEP